MLLFCGLSFAAASLAEEGREINLLIFGNSYSHFFDPLPGIAESMGDKLPPLRLMLPAARLRYGDILIQRAEELLASGGKKSAAIASECYQTLMILLPEHPEVKKAENYLKKNGGLDAAQTAALKEARERPVRENRIETIWKASDKKRTGDADRPGCWSSL